MYNKHTQLPETTLEGPRRLKTGFYSQSIQTRILPVKASKSRGKQNPLSIWANSPGHKKKLGKSEFIKEFGGQGRDRTGDTRIFSPLLYQLSYLATALVMNGRSAGIRTLDPVIKSHLLYQLSYAPIHRSEDWSELRDSNPRQPPWQGGTLPTELSSPVNRKRV